MPGLAAKSGIELKALEVQPGRLQGGEGLGGQIGQ
jgi:hypothetical protein